MAAIGSVPISEDQYYDLIAGNGYDRQIWFENQEYFIINHYKPDKKLVVIAHVFKDERKAQYFAPYDGAKGEGE